MIARREHWLASDKALGMLIGQLTCPQIYASESGPRKHVHVTVRAPLGYQQPDSRCADSIDERACHGGQYRQLEAKGTDFAGIERGQKPESLPVRNRLFNEHNTLIVGIHLAKPLKLCRFAATDRTLKRQERHGHQRKG